MVDPLLIFAQKSSDPWLPSFGWRRRSADVPVHLDHAQKNCVFLCSFLTLFERFFEYVFVVFHQLRLATFTSRTVRDSFVRDSYWSSVTRTY